jgi:hypothetical protein
MPATLTPRNSIVLLSPVVFTPAIVRGGLLAILAAGLIAGFFATGGQATSVAMLHDGAALTRLMRFMAVLKGVMAVAASAAVLWRLGTAISLPWFVLYAMSCGAMAAGPGLIWGMAHVGLGALLMHGGLFATILLVWRDPAVGARLGEMVAARRLSMAV